MTDQEMIISGRLSYSPLETPLSLAPPEGFAMFGHYHADFSDGFHLIWGHTGRIGTISAQALDPNNPEESKILWQFAWRAWDLEQERKRVRD